MMAKREDEFDLESFILALAGGLVLLELLRYAQTTRGFHFQASAPTGLNSLFSSVPSSVSPGGRAFIQSNERFSLYPYPDAGGQAIYWGHKIKPGETFNNTHAEAEQIFDEDIGGVESAINSSVTVALNQDQFDALADLAYNIGIGAFEGSTLVQMLNQGNYAGASQQILRWRKSGGKINQALVTRRSADQQRFNGTA